MASNNKSARLQMGMDSFLDGFVTGKKPSEIVPEAGARKQGEGSAPEEKPAVKVPEVAAEPAPAPETAAVPVSAQGEAARKRGRPKSEGPERDRLSFKIQTEHHKKIVMMSKLMYCTIQDVLDEALTRVIGAYEAQNGPLDVDKDLNVNGKFGKNF